MMNSIASRGLILGAFALVCSIVITGVQYLTAPKIEQQLQQKTLSLINEVISEDSYDNNIAMDCVLITDLLLGSNQAQKVYRARKDNNPVALIAHATAPEGYSGDINFLVSLTSSGIIGGVRVLEHKETPGLGDKIDLRIDDWILDFSNQPADKINEPTWAVKKDGGEFDQFTGATITPRAVVNGVKSSIEFLQANQETLFTQTSSCKSGME